MTNNIKDITIIGAGPIGLFTIFQAGMLNMQCNVIDISNFVGGQCTALYPEKYIYDIPAHPKITAFDFIKNLEQQAARFSPTYYLSQAVLDITKENDTWVTHTSTGNKIYSKKIILATGSGLFRPRKPAIAGLSEFENYSAFYSVQNVKNFQKKTVVIAGGGDSALDWTVELSKIAKKVYLVHRRNKFNGSPATLSQIQKIENIEIITPFRANSIQGRNGQIENISLININNETLSIAADNLLMFFGLETDNSFMAKWTYCPDLHNATIITDPSTQSTSIDGIFAVGDIATYSHKIKLILVGFAESALACRTAYLQIHEKLPRMVHSTTAIKN